MEEQWKSSLFQKSLKSTPNLGGEKFFLQSDDDLPRRFFFWSGTRTSPLIIDRLLDA